MKLDGISEELKETIIRGEAELRDQLDKTGFLTSKKNKIYNVILKYEMEAKKQVAIAITANRMDTELAKLEDDVKNLNEKEAKPIRDRIKSLQKKVSYMKKEHDKQVKIVKALEPGWEKASAILDKRLAEVEKREQKRNNRR